MSYKKAAQILPDELIRQIQQYVDGEAIYIPRADERRRAERTAAASEFGVSFPLIERGLTKENCHAIAAELGIKRPAMYDLGYSNNNCIGCVKGGAGTGTRFAATSPRCSSAGRNRSARSAGAASRGASWTS